MFTPEGAVVLGKLLDGFVLNLQIFVITLIGSLPLGLIIMFGSRSRLGLRVFGRMFRPIRLLTRGFVWVIRGTPLMLQLIFVFYGPGLMGLPPIKSRVTATLVTFIINYAAYFSEIFRGLGGQRDHHAGQGHLPFAHHQRDRDTVRGRQLHPAGPFVAAVYHRRVLPCL